MTGQFYIFLRKGKPLTVCDPDLFLDQIDPCHPFCDRMLHLDSGIHFHKIKFSTLFQQKFNGSCIFVMRCLCRFYRCFAHSPAKLIRNHGTWGFFDHLLMISLHRTVPFS